MKKLSLNTETIVPEDGALNAVQWYDLGRVLRETRFDWDAVVKGTHLINCWYNSHCSFNVFVKDGVVLREEQAHNYPVPNDPDCPDPNPKGCQKGCAASHRLYDPFRLRYPLKRAGARGEGKWKRVSWDEALGDIAEKMVDVMVEHGPHAITMARGTQSAFMPLLRFWSEYFGRPEANPDIGDDHQGYWEVTGQMFTCNSMDDTYYADLIFIWGGNPAQTLQTLFHYIPEARYRGAKVVAITVDYNASAPAADLWISVKPGTDAALALAMCQVVIEEKLYDREFIDEQTDLPLLVRRDNGKFLRESDFKRGGRDYVGYFWDEATGQAAEAPRQTLALGNLKPVLEGDWEVQTLGGTVKVTTVFSLFKEKLCREYRPEQAAKVCGVSPTLIRRLAHEFARAKAVANITQSNFGKYYHGNLMERACVYLWMLCGQIGRRGANWTAFCTLVFPETKFGAIFPNYFRDMSAQLVNHPKYPEWKARGYTDAWSNREAMFEAIQAGEQQQESLLWYFHGGLLDLSKKYNSWDPHLKRPLGEYVNEELGKRTKPVVPSPERPPKMLFVKGANPVRRVRANQYLIDVLFPKLDLLINVDFRWNSTAFYSDYVLPVTCPWYEAYQGGNALWPAIYTPGPGIVAFSGKAVEPPGDAKDEWWVWASLFEKIQEVARSRGVKTVHDPEFNVDKRIDDMGDRFTAGGLYPPDAQEDVMRDLVDNALNLEFKWDEFAEKGWSRQTFLSPFPLNIEQACDFELGEPVVPNAWHIERKEPWSTLTGRMQFYVDHDWYLELGEEFAWHKDSIRAGGDYPLQVNGGHTRWSIHTMWSDAPLMLRLQRGEPLMFMSTPDSAERGISDGDHAEVYNDVGKFEIQVAVSPLVRPGQLLIYHHWENSQFAKWKHFQQVMPTPFNPIEFAPAGAEYPNVRAGYFTGVPGLSDRDTRVEVRKVG